MKNPLPLLAVWPLDYIQNHLNEMHTVLRDRQLAYIPDNTDTNPRFDPYQDKKIARLTPLTCVELKSNKILTVDEHGDSYNYSYKNLGLLSITSDELSRAIETQKGYILKAEMEIQKFHDWIKYMEENKINVFNINSHTEMFLLETFKQVKANPDLTIEELKTLVSKVMS